MGTIRNPLRKVPKTNLESYHVRRQYPDDQQWTRISFYAGFFLMPFLWMVIFLSYRKQVNPDYKDREIIFGFTEEHESVRLSLAKYVSWSKWMFIVYTIIFLTWIVLYIVYYDTWARKMLFVDTENRFFGMPV